MTELDRPHFSVVVPAYQAQSHLAETLDSILAQSWPDWECIVVDDGSTDDTAQVAGSVASKDGRIHVLRQRNQGTGGAYNTGVSAAIGRFIVVCSADDVLLPDHLRRVAAFAETETGYDIYSTDGYVWWPDDTRELVAQTRPADGVLSWSLLDLIGWCFYSVGAAYRRELFDRVGGYRLGVFGEDYDFWLRALVSGARHRYLPEPLSLHRVSSARKSADVQRAYRSDISILSHLRESYALPPSVQTAIDQAVLERQRLIRAAASPEFRLKQRGKLILGRRRTQALKSRARSMGLRQND